MNEETTLQNDDNAHAEHVSQPIDRRDFISSAAMAGGLVAGYGTFAYMAGKFLYPEPMETAWMFVAEVSSVSGGSSITYRTPGGESVVIVRQGQGADATDFLALSNVCPHLGCKVHWEAQNNHFFCPCHNGAFNASGKAISGPPAKAGQELKRFPLKVDSGLLYFQVPQATMTAQRPSTDGHDDCLVRHARDRRSERA